MFTFVPAPAAERLDAYLATREDMDSLPALPGQPGAPRLRRVLFATENGRRLFAADVWHLGPQPCGTHTRRLPLTLA